MAKTIVLLSDSTGDLGERMIRALISQFPKDAFSFQVKSFVVKDGELEKIFNEIKSGRPIIFHTAISQQMKKEITKLAKKNKLHAHDLTGGAMDFLEQASGLQSHPNPSMLHELNKEYDQRIVALNFTVEHDDGLKRETVSQADIVLLGVSRVSKTPTSIYLANKGYKVANVPLVPGVTIEQLQKIRPRPKYVGLFVRPEKLREIRLRRAEAEKIPGEHYTSLALIEEEVKAGQNLFLELGCPMVDVTDRAVEETAALVLKALHLR